MQKNHKKAFSLIELSIVILIVSILISGSLTLSKTSITNNKTKITKERMDAVYRAITTFVAINKRLPCPAALTVVKGVALYGEEAATPGTCTGLFTSTNAPNLVYGMVPTAALGLSPDMAEDGFGTKISFVVDSRFTSRADGSTHNGGFEGTKGTLAVDKAIDSLNIITVQGPSGTDLTTYSVLALISHGNNKHKGFNATSTAQNTTSGTADENSNGCDETYGSCGVAVAGYNANFIAYSTTAGFDDIVLFKTKQQIVRDAGLEFIACSKDEAEYDQGLPWRYTFSNGANHEIKVYSSCGGTGGLERIAKTCGQFGVWGNYTDYRSYSGDPTYPCP